VKLVAGLGNPGARYRGTRHNVGFAVLDRLATRLVPGEPFISSPTGAIQLRWRRAEGDVLFVKPLTYMNLSGQVLRPYLRRPAWSGASDLMVVVDEVAIPVGTYRVRARGSAGGHNGLKDIERALGTSQYPRLRIGVDPPPPRVPQRDWVLGKFSPEQRQLIDPAVARACGAIAVWIDKGVTVAMTQFNGDEGKDDKVKG